MQSVTPCHPSKGTLRGRTGGNTDRKLDWAQAGHRTSSHILEHDSLREHNVVLAAPHRRARRPRGPRGHDTLVEAGHSGILLGGRSEDGVTLARRHLFGQERRHSTGWTCRLLPSAVSHISIH